MATNGANRGSSSRQFEIGQCSAACGPTNVNAMVEFVRVFRCSADSFLDLVELDALCSQGLPGILERDISADRLSVDSMAQSCALFTELVLPMFRAGQCDYVPRAP